MKKSRLAVLLLVSMLLSLVSGPALAADPVEVPVLLSLTGYLAFLGQQEVPTLKGIEAIVNRSGGIHGRPIHFAIQDIQSNPVVAVQIANQLLAQHVPVIIGPEQTAAVAALMPVLKDSVVMYSLSPSVHPPAGSYSFSVMVSSRDLAVVGVRFLRRHNNVRKLAVISSNDAAGQDGVEQIQYALSLPENKGMELVANEHFVVSDVNVSAQAARIKASGAQGVYVQTAGTGFGTVLHSLYDAGVNLPVLTNAGNIGTAQMESYAAFTPKEVYFTGMRYAAQGTARAGPVKDAQTLYYQTMKAQGAPALDIGPSIGWDATWIVVDAFRKFGPSMTAAQLHDYIENLHGFVGINGIMDFSDGGQRGLIENSVLIVRWDPSRKTWLPQ